MCSKSLQGHSNSTKKKQNKTEYRLFIQKALHLLFINIIDHTFFTQCLPPLTNHHPHPRDCKRRTHSFGFQTCVSVSKTYHTGESVRSLLCFPPLSLHTHPVDFFISSTGWNPAPTEILFPFSRKMSLMSEVNMPNIQYNNQNSIFFQSEAFSSLILPTLNCQTCFRLEFPSSQLTRP